MNKMVGGHSGAKIKCSQAANFYHAMVESEKRRI